MSSGRDLLLISDRPDRSRRLADRLWRLHPCRTMGLYEAEDGPDASAAAVITDVCFRDGPAIERLRGLLLRVRTSKTPLVTILQNDSHLERVQAAALGAGAVLPANASFRDIAGVITRTIGLAAVPTASSDDSMARTSAEKARLRFDAIFTGAMRGEAVDRAMVDEAAATVVGALAENDIGQWLEQVWAYDNTTYQHCLLVTGLAAAFAINLNFSERDQKYLTRGAILHDIGKAKIPLEILNKPGQLTKQEMSVMRTHAEAGYKVLHDQGDYEPDLLDVVLRHHELLDGSGYPDGLSGKQIPDPVRLVTISDIYAALIERRSYKRPIAPSEAFRILQGMEGKVEKALVQAFAKVAEKSEEVVPKMVRRT
jgi:putative nucleotidyltransferase with HDIG domain